MSKLYYISQGQTPEQHLINIQLVAENGVDWIQLRLKNHPNEIFLATAQKALEICHRNGVKLFINDQVAVAYDVSADGIHIGQDDISPVDAKVIFKKGLIGGTANTIEQCIELAKKKVDE